MAYRWAAPALVLALCAATAQESAGQSAQQPRGRKAGTLGQNVPNPFNPETSIPFTVGDGACRSGSGKHSVTLKVFNVLAQLVAIPVLRDTLSAADTTTTPVVGKSGKAVDGLLLECGPYLAFWDGKYMRTGQEAPPGVYVYQLVVDGQPVIVRKMLRAR